MKDHSSLYPAYHHFQMAFIIYNLIIKIDTHCSFGITTANVSGWCIVKLIANISIDVSIYSAVCWPQSDHNGLEGIAPQRRNNDNLL